MKTMRDENPCSLFVLMYLNREENLSLLNNHGKSLKKKTKKCSFIGKAGVSAVKRAKEKVAVRF